MTMNPAVITPEKVIIVIAATAMIIPIVKGKNKKESGFTGSQRGCRLTTSLFLGWKKRIKLCLYPV